MITASPETLRLMRNLRIHGPAVLLAGGPGSGCHGPNCGRPKGTAHSVLTHYGWKKETKVKVPDTTTTGKPITTTKTYYSHPQHGAIEIDHTKVAFKHEDMEKGVVKEAKNGSFATNLKDYVKSLGKGAEGPKAPEQELVKPMSEAEKAIQPPAGMPWGYKSYAGTPYVWDHMEQKYVSQDGAKTDPGPIKKFLEAYPDNKLTKEEAIKVFTPTWEKPESMGGWKPGKVTPVEPMLAPGAESPTGKGPPEGMSEQYKSKSSGQIVTWNPEKGYWQKPTGFNYYQEDVKNTASWEPVKSEGKKPPEGMALIYKGGSSGKLYTWNPNLGGWEMEGKPGHKYDEHDMKSYNVTPVKTETVDPHLMPGMVYDKEIDQYVSKGGLKVPAPNSTGFTYVGPANELGGAHEKYYFTDPSGGKWLFKPAETIGGKSSPLMAEADAVASKVAQALRPGSAVMAKVVTVDLPDKGKTLGSIQNMVPDVREHYKDFTNKTITQDWEVKGLQQEQVVDWLISNHDAHAGQFLRTKGREVIGIDKSQAFKFFPKDFLSDTYHPNQQEQPPLYNKLWAAVKAGDVKADPKDALPVIKRAEAIGDLHYRAMLTPYASARFTNQTEADKFLDEAVERKHNLRTDFERFYADVFKKPGFQFEPPPKPPAKVPSNMPEDPEKLKLALGAPPEVHSAVAEAFGKYSGKDRNYSIDSRSAWAADMYKLQGQFAKDHAGKYPEGDEMVQIQKQAAIGKGAYVEAAAKLGYKPYDLEAMISTINSWQNGSHSNHKAAIQKVVDGKGQEPDAKMFAFEQAMTYAKLKEQYPKGYITLYRGSKTDVEIPEVGQVGVLKSKGAESWSGSLQFVKDWVHTKAEDRMVMKAEVPLQYVITSRATNKAAFPGYANEDEYIVAFPGKTAKYLRQPREGMEVSMDIRYKKKIKAQKAKKMELTDSNWLYSLRGKKPPVGKAVVKVLNLGKVS